MSHREALRLIESWRQCERHMHHLKHALRALTPLLPMMPETVATMDDEAIQDWDQFILRFTKLQDTMGAQLYPALLAYLQEPYENRPMLDKLHRLEALSYLDNIEQWNTLRVIRNAFAHDYPQDDALKAASLNLATASVATLEFLLAKIEPVVAGLHFTG